jgi:3-hydroxyacyl-[acyl-carrier-protein] dehydratase
MESTLTTRELLDILPHRYPFLLIDRVLEQVDGPNKTSRVDYFAKALKNVTMNEPFFQGHFPNFPLMPGVLLVEAMAQTAALAYYRKGDDELDFMIAGVEKAKFRKPVTPGDQLELTAKILKDRRNMILAECEAKVGGVLVAEATILAVILPRSESRKS